MHTGERIRRRRNAFRHFRSQFTVVSRLIGHSQRYHCVADRCIKDQVTCRCSVRADLVSRLDRQVVMDYRRKGFLPALFRFCRTVYNRLSVVLWVPFYG